MYITLRLLSYRIWNFSLSILCRQCSLGYNRIYIECASYVRIEITPQKLRLAFPRFISRSNYRLSTFTVLKVAKECLHLALKKKIDEREISLISFH